MNYSQGMRLYRDYIINGNDSLSDPKLTSFLKWGDEEARSNVRILYIVATNGVVYEREVHI